MNIRDSYIKIFRSTGRRHARKPLRSLLTVAILSLLALSPLLTIIPVARASTTYYFGPYPEETIFHLGSSVCTDNGGAWNSVTDTCTVPSYVTWAIFPNTTIYTDSGTLVNYGTIFTQPTPGAPTSPGQLEAHGLIVNQGDVQDQGRIVVDTGMSFDNSGTVFVSATGNFTVGLDAWWNNYGYVMVVGSVGVLAGGTVYNYGTFTDDYGTYSPVDGTIVNSCTGSMSASVPWSPPFDCVAEVTDFASLVSGLASSLNDIQNSISGLQSSLTGLQSSLNDLQTALDGVSASLSYLQTSVDGLASSLTTLSSSLSADFGSLSSAIADIGRTGPTVGTSNDAFVVASPAFSTRSSFSPSSSDWVQISVGTASSTVISGYSVSVSSGTAMDAILYISTTSAPGSAGATYAIPLGTVKGPAPSTGQLRFPFSIPAGTPIYVQVVSSPSSATITVQLQQLSTPVNP